MEAGVLVAFLLLVSCDVQNTLKIRDSSAARKIQLGQLSYLFETACGNYGHFIVEVPDPCQDLIIQLRTYSGRTNLHVSTEKQVHPDHTNLAWSTYIDKEEDLRIYSRDPYFRAGNFYITVHADCLLDASEAEYKSSKYTILATQNSSEIEGENIFNKTVEGNLLTNDYQYHRFCMPECYQVLIQLDECASPEECLRPTIIVSPTEERPTLHSFGWIFGEQKRSIVIDPCSQNVRPGQYFISIYGREICSGETKCAYLNNTAYNLSVIPSKRSNSSCVRLKLSISCLFVSISLVVFNVIK